MRGAFRAMSLVVVTASLLSAGAIPAHATYYTGWYRYASGYSCGQYFTDLTPSPDRIGKTYDKGWRKYGGGPDWMIFQHVVYSSLDGRMHVYGPSDQRPVPVSLSHTTNVYALPNLPTNHPAMWVEHYLFIEDEQRGYNMRRLGTDNSTGCTHGTYTTLYDARLNFRTSFPASAPYIPLP